METSAIELKNVSKSFAGQGVLNHIDLCIQQSSISCLIGKSGSGKTTCLRLMNGLIAPDQGEVRIYDQPLNYDEIVRLRRSMGYAQQGSGLFPHLNVLENMSLIAKRSGWSAKQIKERSEHLLEMVQMSELNVANKYPTQLSGGQKQRVGIARSLFMSPKIMLMDEPFGALDPSTREELQDLFIDLQKKFKLTVVIVTHDLQEAFKMADKIIILNQGRVEQQGSQGQLLLQPQSDFVQKYLEPMGPRRRLEQMKLYMVMSTDFYVIQEDLMPWTAVNLENRSKKTFESLESLKDFLIQRNQQWSYFVDKHGALNKVINLSDGKEITDQIPIAYGRDSLLQSFKSFVRGGFERIIVLNNDNKLVGCLSREAIENI